jgi:hypothetical protein
VFNSCGLSFVCSNSLPHVGEASYLEARVAGVEVKLLLVPRSVWDVRFTVDVGQNGSVGINDAQRVVVCIIAALKERDGENDIQLLGEALESRNEIVDTGIRRKGHGELEMLLLLDVAEVWRQEELLREATAVLDAS